MKNMQACDSIDQYLAIFSGETLKKLEQLREIIHELIPEAKEKISYGIPTFTLNGKNLVHFAGYDTHIGFYPGPMSIAIYKNELFDYITSKGTVQFPTNKPFPLELIKKLIQASIEQNLKK